MDLAWHVAVLLAFAGGGSASPPPGQVPGLAVDDCVKTALAAFAPGGTLLRGRWHSPGTHVRSEITNHAVRQAKRRIVEAGNHADDLRPRGRGRVVRIRLPGIAAR